VPASPAKFEKKGVLKPSSKPKEAAVSEKSTVVEGRVWLIKKDNIDTDMIITIVISLSLILN